MHPILFHFAGVEIQTYLITMFFGIILSGLYLERKIKNYKLSTNFINDYFTPLALIFFVTGRLGAVLLNLSIYKSNLISILYFWDLNFSFYIGLSFLGLAFLLLCIAKKEKFSKWIDMLLAPFLVLILFLSIGEFANGFNYGNPSNLPFSVIFNIPEVRYIIPVHPVQLYEFVGAFLILLFALYFGRKKRIFGTIGFLGFSLFFTLELFLEFFRAKSDLLVYGIKFHIIFFGLLLAGCLIGLILKSHRDFNLI